MKKLLILLAVISAVTLQSCTKQYLLCRYINRTEEDITIVLGYFDGRSDTTIVIDTETGGLSPIMEEFCSLPPNGTNDVVVSNRSDYGACDDYLKKYNGLLHVFILRTADVENYGWKDVVESNMVLQRYDIDTTCFCSYALSSHGLNIYFPPTPDMVNISMWPPYGTYAIHLPND